MGVFSSPEGSHRRSGFAEASAPLPGCPGLARLETLICWPSWCSGSSWLLAWSHSPHSAAQYKYSTAGALFHIYKGVKRVWAGPRLPFALGAARSVGKFGCFWWWGWSSFGVKPRTHSWVIPALPGSRTWPCRRKKERTAVPWLSPLARRFSRWFSASASWTCRPWACRKLLKPMKRRAGSRSARSSPSWTAACPTIRSSYRRT